MHIQLHNISQAFGTKTYLREISGDVPSGSRLGIIGKSGAGKTTLLRCIAGLLPLSQGQIIYDDQNATTWGRKDWQCWRHRVGFITQGVTLLKQKTVFENIALSLIHHQEKNYNAVYETLDAVQLTSKANNYPDELSGGQRQRVAIARALVHQPALVLCDEFTSALDPNTTDDILVLLRSLQKPGVTFICVTHDLHVVHAFAEHVWVLDDGQLVEQGTVQDILNHPKHNASQNLLQTYHKRPNQLCVLANEDLIKIVFETSTVNQPILSRIIRESNIDINIVSGSIDALGDSPQGYLFVTCSKERSQQLITLLQQQNISACFAISSCSN